MYYGLMNLFSKYLSPHLGTMRFLKTQYQNQFKIFKLSYYLHASFPAQNSILRLKEKDQCTNRHIIEP